MSDDNTTTESLPSEEQQPVTPSSSTLERRTGQVKWFDKSKGYGFITDSGNKVDYFVHHSALKTQGTEEYAYLVAGEYVDYQLSQQPASEDGSTPGRELAIAVTGVNGGGLMYKTIKSSTKPSTLSRPRPRIPLPARRGRGLQGAQGRL